MYFSFYIKNNIALYCTLHIRNIMKNPTYYKTIVNSPTWKEWTKHQEEVMEFDIWESIETGWLSERHFEEFIKWVKLLDNK